MLPPVTAMLANSGTGRDVGELLAATAQSERPTSADREQQRSPPPGGEVKASFSERLRQSKLELQAKLDQAASELSQSIDKLRSAGDRDVPPMLKHSTKMTLDWLSGASHGLLDELSSAHQQLARQQLKTQATSLEMKLHTSRTANNVKLANQAAELEGTINRRVEERLRELSGAEGAALAHAHRQLEEATVELAQLRLKMETQTEASNMLQQLLRASEATVVGLREQMARCEASLQQALAELGVASQTNATLEERVDELVRESQRQHQEVAQARTDLDAALADLDLVTTEKQTLSEQIGQLVDRLHSAQAQAATASALSAENAELKEEVARLMADNKELREAGGSDAQAVRRAKERLAMLESEREQCDAEIEAAVAELVQHGTFDEELAAEAASEAAAEAGAAGGEAEKEPSSADASFRRHQLPKRIKGLGTSAVDRIRSLVGLWKAAELSKSERSARVASLEKELAEAYATMSAAGASSAEVQRWKAEAEKQQLIVLKCQQRVGTVVEGVGPSINPEGGPPPLPLMVERMLDKYTGLGTALDKMNDELEDATEAMHQLRAELELADLKASSRVNAAREHFKSERANLVKTALNSLQQLRVHLIHALAGLREVPNARQVSLQGNRLSWNPARRCWFVQPSGKVDELLLKLEMPPLAASGIGTSGRSPRLAKGERPFTHPISAGALAPASLMPSASPVSLDTALSHSANASFRVPSPSPPATAPGSPRVLLPSPRSFKKQEGTAGLWSNSPRPVSARVVTKSPGADAVVVIPFARDAI